MSDGLRFDRISTPALESYPALERHTTESRITPPPRGRQFREALEQGANNLLSGVGNLTSWLPFQPSLSASLRAGGEGGLPGDGLNPQQPDAPSTLLPLDDSARYLSMQQRINAENRRYTALSNVLKTRHETAKAAINNIR